MNRKTVRSQPLSEKFDVIAEASRQWSAQWGSGPIPSMEAVTSLMRAQQILLTRLNLLLGPHNLTFPRYEALMILYLSRQGSLPLGKIGERLQVHPTSVTSLIDGLEKQGYVTREPHRTDRRTVLAAITAQGRQVAQHATAALNIERFATAPLADKELAALTDTLRPLRADEDGF
jgi:DNA-binding MarR family transcriptional regulator